MSRFGRHVLELDCEAEAARIGAWLRSSTAQVLHRRGLVVAISGGIDSSVCATLAVRALGTSRVRLLILPEHDSDPDSATRAALLAAHLGVEALTFDIAPTLMSIGWKVEKACWPFSSARMLPFRRGRAMVVSGVFAKEKAAPDGAA